ncbi:MAG: hypothetical protein IJN67_07920 [Oscillospiraceae bacterium]|nr:hypothetical protein [Oscillospiraceae bacterium]
MNPKGKMQELDLWLLLAAVRKKLWAILAAGLAGALAALLLTWLLVTPQYESQVLMYVQQTQSAKDLADSFEVVVKMRESLMEVIRYTGVPYNHTQLHQRIHVSAVKETDFFQITVSGPDAKETAMLANAIGELLPEQVARIMEGTTVKAVGEAIPALYPSVPNYPNSALLGYALGVLAVLGWVLLRVVFSEDVN